VVLASVRFEFGSGVVAEGISVAFGAVIWMFVAPVLFVRYVLGRSLREFGFRFPENPRRTFVLTTLVFVVLAPFMFVFAHQVSFTDFYVLGGISPLTFIIVSVLLSAVYYAVEEFLFRGVLFWGLWRRIGVHSYWVTSVLFALLHLHKPSAEVPFAFVASLLFCYLSRESKSFIPAAVVHFGIAVLLNGLIAFG